jgi:hypothetical protein
MAEGPQQTGGSLAPQPVHLVQPKTRRGRRHLEKRGPKLVSLLRNSLFLQCICSTASGS